MVASGAEWLVVFALATYAAVLGATKPMKKIAEMLDAVEAGDISEGERLMPAVYDELRTMAGNKMQGERQDQRID